MASGTARITETTQIKTISTAVHLGTPIPLIRLQEATARYLKMKTTFYKLKKLYFIELHILFSKFEAISHILLRIYLDEA